MVDVYDIRRSEYSSKPQKVVSFYDMQVITSGRLYNSYKACTFIYKYIYTTIAIVNRRDTTKSLIYIYV